MEDVDLLTPQCFYTLSRHDGTLSIRVFTVYDGGAFMLIKYPIRSADDKFWLFSSDIVFVSPHGSSRSK